MLTEVVMMHTLLLAFGLGLGWYKWDYPSNWYHRSARIVLVYNTIGSLIVAVQSKQVGVFLFLFVISLLSLSFAIVLNKQKQ